MFFNDADKMDDDIFRMKDILQCFSLGDITADHPAAPGKESIGSPFRTGETGNLPPGGKEVVNKMTADKP